jgi:hypothetical protein
MTAGVWRVRERPPTNAGAWHNSSYGQFAKPAADRPPRRDRDAMALIALRASAASSAHGEKASDDTTEPDCG